jgi:hypothetical protein
MVALLDSVNQERRKFIGTIVIDMAAAQTAVDPL